MGTSADGQRLARMAKLRLYSHDDGGPAYSVHWHWQGWDDSDGTVLDQSGGAYTGSADEVAEKLHSLIIELRAHMERGLDPFPTDADLLERFDELSVRPIHLSSSSSVTPQA